MAIRRQAEDQLRHMAFHDRLTGLCNRDLLMDRLQQCIDRVRSMTNEYFAVLFLDIDRFKQINDSLGHTVGDQLLVAISARLRACLRSTETVTGAQGHHAVARIGGDEFIILLEAIQDVSHAKMVAQRVQQSLSEPFKLGPHEVFTTASIGITSSQLPYNSPGNLLRDADTAMYHAKAAGKARHEVFSQQMHARAMAELRLGNDLRRGIANDQFCVYDQPIVSLRTGGRGFDKLTGPPTLRA